MAAVAASKGKRIQQAPQAAIDEFWDKFTTKAPGKATTIIPRNPHVEKAVKRTTQTSFDEAVALCRTKVRKIVDECRAVNQKYRDPHFDLEFDLKFGSRNCLDSLWNIKDREPPEPLLRPRSIKRVVDIFDEPQFYIDDATADDEVGVYGFVFHRDAEWFSVIIDDKLYLTKPDYDESYLERNLWDDRERINSEDAYRKIYQSNSGALYFAQCENPNETWLPLLEKAYAKAHGDYSAIEGGFTGEAVEDLTGGVTTELYTTDILSKEVFWKQKLLRVNQDCLISCSTGFASRGRGERNGIVEMHAYSVMKAVELNGERLVHLKNPWGKGEWKGAWSDGSKEWTPEWLRQLNHTFGDDGAFWISYTDLLKKYSMFDVTRLFGSDWTSTTKWTTLEVPWVSDYHKTSFALTITRAGPVVIVLSQLDDRYFRGLEGQYRFDLGFRLHRAGDGEAYVVRSEPAYRMRRSVNVELDLEAGNYEVHVRVEATRNDDLLPTHQVIRKYAKSRRDKLMHTGLAYDIAHGKGLMAANAKSTRASDEKVRGAREQDKLRSTIRSILQEGEKRRPCDWTRNQESSPNSSEAGHEDSDCIPTLLEMLGKEIENAAINKNTGNSTNDNTGSLCHCPSASALLTSEEPEEFEMNPWNAVVVVGLRVYHMVGPESQVQQETGDVVTLQVLSPQTRVEVESSDNAMQVAETTKGLDIDDTEKDATLDGGIRQRKKRIVVRTSDG
ncbi:Calpain-8 like protein [Verticillium longisporum]|uniref:Calpain-8 like protein n=1 Tax=Verticillium longisporum TaxID=100787 RepID=A0A8I2Z2Y5_VERLO|nr:Calpain-8 like protein [Verticillium longisporum]